jgi:hypothetical protein
MMDPGRSDHARHPGYCLCAKPARRVRHVPVWLYTYTLEVGIESDFALVGIRTWCHSIDVGAHGFFIGL